MSIDATPIRAFLSYAHDDDEEFGIVEPLVSKLRSLVRAKSGRTLEVFVDRESIGWGDNWRDRISDSVEGATVFIPLLSANYLDSSWCRDEFLAFHSKAEVLGVTELLLPILLFESPLFVNTNTDEVVQIAEALQYKCIEEAVIQGFESPEWLRCNRDLATALIAAIGRAEEQLESPPDAVRPGTVEVTEPESGGEVNEAEETGLTELMEAMTSAINDMTAIADRLNPAIEEFGAVPETVGGLPDEPSPQQVRIWTIRLADGFKRPGLELETGGVELLDATKQLDESIVGIVHLMDQVEDSDFKESILDGLRSAVGGFNNVVGVAQTMDELMASLQPAEVMSVPLRKSLVPARRGITAVRDSARMIESWKSMRFMLEADPGEQADGEGDADEE